MNNQRINELFAELSTPLVADACLRLDEYLIQHRGDETYTFRQHLHSIGGALRSKSQSLSRHRNVKFIVGI